MDGRSCGKVPARLRVGVTYAVASIAFSCFRLFGNMFLGGGALQRVHIDKPLLLLYSNTWYFRGSREDGDDDG